MSRKAALGDLIELAYQGALDQERFNEFIRETARCIGAPSGNVQVFEPRTANCLFVAAQGPNYSDRVRELYQSEFMHIEPHRKFVNREHLGNDRKVLLCHDFINDADMAMDPFFQEYAIPETNSRWFAGNLSFEDPELAIQYGFARLPDQTPFNERARKTLELLTPHLRRAVKISIGFNRTRNVAAALETALTRTWAVIYLLDQNGQIVWSAGKPDEGPLRSRANRLFARTPAAQSRVDRAVKDTLDNVARPDAGDIVLPDETGQQCPVSVRLAGPLATGLGGPPHARIMVLVGGAAPPPLAGERLAQMFGLTHAEARLAVDLAEGLTLEECAARYEVTQHTVRSQLKSIFNKTSVRRQGEMIALVWRMSKI